MAVEKFIEGRHQGERHFGRRSTRRGLDCTLNKIREAVVFDARRQRTFAHDGGHYAKGDDSDYGLSDSYTMGLASELERLAELKEG